MAPSAETKKKRAILIGVGVTLMAIVIIVPIAIEVSQDNNEAPTTLGNRIECFPFSEYLIMSQFKLIDSSVFMFCWIYFYFTYYIWLDFIDQKFWLDL